MTESAVFTAKDAAVMIAVPSASDDKYSRGVLGVITGSTRYPGAAILGVDAALHTGVGMVRYIGPQRPSDLVLQRRPEAVTVDGRVQAWLLGSGIDPTDRSAQLLSKMIDAIEQGLPVVLDSGALEFHDRATGPVVITPHYRELGRTIGADPDEIAADPAGFARRASDALGVTVLLKGATTCVAGPGVDFSTATAPTWLATAGAGDALGGILGALVATHTRQIEEDPQALARLAATAAFVHGMAAQRASAGGPLTVLNLIAALPSTIAAVLAQGVTIR